MYMNGRGPMMGGHRDPMMGAPMRHHRHMGGPRMGFDPGFRPMCRPMRMTAPLRQVCYTPAVFIRRWMEGMR